MPRHRRSEAAEPAWPRPLTTEIESRLRQLTVARTVGYMNGAELTSTNIRRRPDVGRCSYEERYDVLAGE